MRPSRRSRIRALTVVAAVGLPLAALTACGGTGEPDGLADLRVSTTVGTIPSWFPAEFPPPPGGTVVDVISRPLTGDVKMGRTVTWRVDKDFDAVLADLDRTLQSLGWTPTQRLSTGEDDTSSKRTAIYLENGTVQVIRVFTDENLDGVQVTVELPPRS